MKLPSARGPLSRLVISALVEGGYPRSRLDAFHQAVADVERPLQDGDLNLALACCYELSYRGFDGVDDALEWDPDVLALRSALERRFEQALLAELPMPAESSMRPSVSSALRQLVDQDTSPSVSAFMLRRASVGHYQALLRQRSVYHLKEADPHSWQIPRLSGRAKAALVEIQADEYGGGRPERMHAALFAKTMVALGLDPTYGHYWDDAFAETLATVNLMSLLGLHRRLRGALVGHLAALEMTSTIPNRRYGNGLRRLGYGVDATDFFDEHVEADAVHEQLAAVDLCGSFVAAEPERRPDVLWGAAACLALDAAAGEALLRSWQAARLHAVVA